MRLQPTVLESDLKNQPRKKSGIGMGKNLLKFLKEIERKLIKIVGAGDTSLKKAKKKEKRSLPYLILIGILFASTNIRASINVVDWSPFYDYVPPEKESKISSIPEFKESSTGIRFEGRPLPYPNPINLKEGGFIGSVASKTQIPKKPKNRQKCA